MEVGIIGYESAEKTMILGALSGVGPSELFEPWRQIWGDKVLNERAEEAIELCHPKGTTYPKSPYFDVMKSAFEKSCANSISSARAMFEGVTTSEHA